MINSRIKKTTDALTLSIEILQYTCHQEPSWISLTIQIDQALAEVTKVEVRVEQQIFV